MQGGAAKNDADGSQAHPAHARRHTLPDVVERIVIDSGNAIRPA
jgi:hypothetical protein